MRLGLGESGIWQIAQQSTQALGLGRLVAGTYLQANIAEYHSQYFPHCVLNADYRWVNGFNQTH